MTTNSEACGFAELFLSRASAYTQNYAVSKSISLGSELVKLHINKETYFGGLISDAFLDSNLAEKHCKFSLHIWDSSFPDSIPDFSWANEFIYSNQVVPFELSNPYRILFDRGQGMISVFNTQSGSGAVWMRDHSQLDARCFISPFRTIMSWITNSFGGEIIHASGISINGEGFLISGPSGSGKSTLALYAALNGCSIIADDAVLYLNEKLYPIYSRAKVSKDNDLLPTNELDLIEIEKPNESKAYFLLESLSKNFVRESNMSGFIFPSICDMSHIEKVEFSVGAKYLLNHSLRELFGGLAENKLRLIQMLKKYNSYRMALSGDLDRDYKKLLEISNI
jgi:ABC-type polar amino acid transport system ATPase subunit